MKKEEEENLSMTRRSYSAESLGTGLERDIYIPTCLDKEAHMSPAFKFRSQSQQLKYEKVYNWFKEIKRGGGEKRCCK